LEEKPLNLKTLLSFFEKEFLVKNGFRKKRKRKKEVFLGSVVFLPTNYVVFPTKELGYFWKLLFLECK